MKKKKKKKKKIWSRTELIRKHNRIAQKNKWAFFWIFCWTFSLHEMNAVVKVVYRLAYASVFHHFFSSSFRFNVNRVQNILQTSSKTFITLIRYFIFTVIVKTVHNSRFDLILRKLGKATLNWHKVTKLYWNQALTRLKT